MAAAWVQLEEDKLRQKDPRIEVVEKMANIVEVEGFGGEEMWRKSKERQWRKYETEKAKRAVQRYAMRPPSQNSRGKRRHSFIFGFLSLPRKLPLSIPDNPIEPTASCLTPDTLGFFPVAALVTLSHIQCFVPRPDLYRCVCGLLLTATSKVSLPVHNVCPVLVP
jgi:hypothetical protein